jgi:TPR repeat protein
MRGRVLQFLCVLAVWCSDPVCAATASRGVAAYEAGNYRAAYQDLIGPARQGDVRAQYYVGAVLASGSTGATPDILQAVDWFRRSAEGGYADGMQAYGYALLYKTPQLRHPDPDAALRWLQKAAAAGSATAMVDLARFSAAGYRMPEDAQRAAAWLAAAARTGDATARTVERYFRQQRPEYYYDNALRMIAIDDARTAARRMALKSAQGGYTPGIYLAGVMLKWGVGGPRDTAASIPYLSRAADARYPDAVYELGKSYEIGFGVPVKFDRALALYDQAAALGQPEARAAARRMRTRATFAGGGGAGGGGGSSATCGYAQSLSQNHDYCIDNFTGDHSDLIRP